MQQLKKNNFYLLLFLIFSLKTVPQNNIPQLIDEIIIQKIEPHLDLITRDKLRKSCKTYYKEIKPLSLKAFKNKCEHLTPDEYVNAIIYYYIQENKLAMKHLIKTAKYSNQKNFPMTKAIYELNGYKLAIDSNTSEIARICRKVLKQCKYENSQISHYAIFDDNFMGLQFFFTLNNNPNIAAGKSETPLHHITFKKDKFSEYRSNKKIEAIIKNMKLLLMHPRIQCNAQDDQGNTPLHYAANFKLIDYLLAVQNIDLNIKNNKGETPLFYALQHRGRSIIKEWKHNDIKYNDYQFEQLLNDSRTDVNTQNNDGDTPLHYSIKNPRLTYLQRHHPCLDIGYAPQLSYDNILAQKLLSHHNIDRNIQNNKEETALHYAAQATQLNKKDHGFSYIQKDLEDKINTQKMEFLLIYKDIFININNIYGETPLVYAIRTNNIIAIKMLCSYINRDDIPQHQKLNINTIDDRDLTPLDHAIAIGNGNVINLLIQHGALRTSQLDHLQQNLLELNPNDTVHISFYSKHQKIIFCSFAGIIGILVTIMWKYSFNGTI